MNLILIRGLPGSGKSSLARQLLSADCQDNKAWFEADHYFEDAEGNYVWDRTKIREAHEWCQNMTRTCLEHDMQVIVSNTFTTAKELNPYFSIAKSFGIIPTIYTCCNNWGSTHNVPEDTMTAMRQRFEHNIEKLFAGM